jgi:glycerol-3-phosphate dehydrogenase (NAD(P)+)
MLIVGVPTHGFGAVLMDAAPRVRPRIPVVSLSKGFEQGTLLRMTEVIRDVLPGRPAAALSGPNIAREIISGMAAASVIATGTSRWPPSCSTSCTAACSVVHAHRSDR